MIYRLVSYTSGNQIFFLKKELLESYRNPLYENRWYVDAQLPGAAAKKFAELGWRGRTTIEDENGNESSWDLKCIEICYAYPLNSSTLPVME